MALSIVKGLLDQYIQSLVDEGVLSYQFSHIQNLRRPDYVEQLINTYCNDVEAILLELTSYNDRPIVDFSQMLLLAKQVEESSASIGAEHVRLACLHLIQACDHMHTKDFYRALNLIKNEFARTQYKLLDVVQMERRIMRLEMKQQN